LGPDRWTTRAPLATIGAWREAREEDEDGLDRDGSAYELEALETGQRLALRASDWENLLGLARRHGWRPSAGLGHYLGRRVIPPPEARALAGALEGPLADLPPERRREPRPAGGAPDRGPAAGASLLGPGADHKAYFAWQRRWIVREVVWLCRRGAVEVRPM
jgi:hypothetical protein